MITPQEGFWVGYNAGGALHFGRKSSVIGCVITIEYDEMKTVYVLFVRREIALAFFVVVSMTATRTVVPGDYTRYMQPNSPGEPVSHHCSLHSGGGIHPLTRHFVIRVSSHKQIITS